MIHIKQNLVLAYNVSQTVTLILTTMRSNAKEVLYTRPQYYFLLSSKLSAGINML